MGRLTVVGLGPGDPGLLTAKAADILTRADKLILRTKRHPAADFLAARGVSFETLDALYETCDNFDALNLSAADAVLGAAKACDAVYAVPGAADLSDATLRELSRRGAAFEVVPGVSGAAPALGLAMALGISADSSACRVVAARDLPAADIDVRETLVVTQLNDPLTASDAKLALMEYFPDAWRIVRVAGGRAALCALCEADRAPKFDHESCLVVPPVKTLLDLERFGFAQLCGVMEILRAPGGCPWDAAQTHGSLEPYLIEEAYEALEAIRRSDPDAMTEEFGDLLLQVVFHASLSRDTGDFSIRDVTSAVCRKMINRHPHVFFRDDAEKNAKNWEAIKKEEKGFDTLKDELADVPRSMPSLLRAQKLQKKTAQTLGLYRDRDGAGKRAAAYLDAARMSGSEGAFAAALFETAAAARACGVDAESALSKACEAFMQLFSGPEGAQNPTEDAAGAQICEKLK